MSFFFFQVLTFILIGRPQDVFPVLAPLRIALVFTFLTLAATLIENKRVVQNSFLKLAESKKYNLFYLFMIISIPFAYYRGGAFKFVFLTYLANIIFFYLFLTHADSLKRVKQIVFTVSFSILFYSMFSLIKGSFSNGRFSFGTMYDPNDLAFVLVSLLPLSALSIISHKGWVKKSMGIAAIGISLLIILLTGSRSGLLGLISISLILLFAKKSGVKPAIKALLIVVSVSVLLLYGGKINTERYMTIADIGSDYNVQDEYGRLEIWKRGLYLTAAHPVTGVGATCFPMVIGAQREAEGRIPKWQVAHNSFIQVSSELGLIGFFIFVSLILHVANNFKAVSTAELSVHNTAQLKTTAKYLQIGFIGCLITSFFLTQAYSILFTLFFAFSATLNRLQRAP